MSVLVADCPRCKSQRISFDLLSYVQIRVEWGWQSWYEAFCVCRKCLRSTVFVVAEKGIDEGKIIKGNGLHKADIGANHLVLVKDYISLKDSEPTTPPEFLPERVCAVFSEASRCLAVGCFNAAGAMFRLCIDLASKSKLPDEDSDGLNAKIRRNLGLRLPWLFQTGRLPKALEDLSTCIKEDGNDGAHDGTLSIEDANDLADFTFALLNRIYSEPERLQQAKMRRDARRETH